MFLRAKTVHASLITLIIVSERSFKFRMALTEDGRSVDPLPAASHRRYISEAVNFFRPPEISLDAILVNEGGKRGYENDSSSEFVSMSFVVKHGGSPNNGEVRPGALLEFRRGL